MKMKLFLALTLTMVVSAARGQIYINSYRFESAAPQLLLDEVSGAIGGFSFRKLRNAYTGNCIIVRRSNDNELDTIGFVNNYLDTTKLKTFCGANSCFVRTWYDQSDGSLVANANQTTLANQPRIVNAGTLEKFNQDVALFFDGSNDVLLLDANSYQWTKNIDHFNSYIYHSVSSYNTGAIFFASIGTASTTSRIILFTPATVIRTINRRLDADASNSASSSTKSTNTAYLSNSIIKYASGSVEQYINNSLDGTSTTGTSGSTSNTNSLAVNIGTVASDVNQFSGYISEMVFYNTDKSSSRTTITNNINNFYLIY